MKTIHSTALYSMATLTLILILMSGCAPASTPVPPMRVPTAIPQSTAPPSEPVSGGPQTVASLEEQLDYTLKKPDTLIGMGYTLDSVLRDEATQSVCLQYRFKAENGDSVLFLAQGPAASAPLLEQVPDWPEYAFRKENVNIGGAVNAQELLGWRRKGWACTQAAETENSRYSFALAPRYTWEADGLQFDLYSGSGGCRTPGGLTSLNLLRIAEELTGTSTHPANELDPDCLLSIADVVKMSGFEIKEPTLPQDVSFYYATYEETPAPVVTLLFLHDQHPDMGRFFQITITMEALPFFKQSCGDQTPDTCEMIQIGDITVVYQFLNPAEQLDWASNEYFYSLFRSAGEPGKVYKEDLLQVVNGIK